MKRVVVIGGGISGLSAAYFLKEEAAKKDIDLDYTLIEKSDRLGGNIITEKIDHFIVEGGPDNFLSQKPWALELSKKLGLGHRIMNTNKDSQTFVLSKGKLHPLPEGFVLMIPTKIMPFLFNSLISIRGKIRMVLDLVKPKTDPRKDVSLGDFVSRRLGKEAVDKIAEPLVAGVHAGKPETMSLKSSFPKFLEMEQKYGSLIRAMLAAKKMAKKAPQPEGDKPTMFVTLKGGLVELVDAIVNNLDKESIRLETTVKNIEKAKDGTYVVNIEGSKPIIADSVILTTPAYISAKLLKDMDPFLSGNLKQIPYVSTATISLAYKRSDLKEPLKGFGLVIPRTENRKIMAATWTSNKYAHRAPEDTVLIRCFVGGNYNQELVDLEYEDMIRLVRKELKEIVGIEAEPILTRVFRWKRAMPQYIIGHSQRMEQLDERLKDHPGLYLTGSAYKGIGIPDSVHYGEITASKALSK